MKNVLKTLFFAVCFFGVASVAQAQTTNNNVAKTDMTKKKKMTWEEIKAKKQADLDKSQKEAEQAKRLEEATKIATGGLNNTPKPTPTDKDKPKKKE